MKIAIASGKGGTGKTLVSTNLYAALQNTGKNVTLVDCDAEEPNVTIFISDTIAYEKKVTQNLPVINTQLCTFCGDCYNYCNYNAIFILPETKHIQVIADLCHDCGACIVACKHGAISEIPKQIGKISSMLITNTSSVIEGKAEVGVYSPVPIIKKSILEAEANSITILDSPPGISCPFIATVDKADYVVLVTEPTPFGLHDLQLSVETLQQMNKPFGVVVNRAGLGNNDVYSWLSQNSIPLLMEIPFDKKIARWYSKGWLITESYNTYQSKFINLYNNILEHYNK